MKRFSPFWCLRIWISCALYPLCTHGDFPHIHPFDAEGVRFLRVRPEPPRPEVLTLREVRIGGE